jgi:single-stranded-DNA-specific exonuclease
MPDPAEAPAKPPPFERPRRRWDVAAPAPPDLARRLEMPALWAQLLHNRGITDPADARAFLGQEEGTFHDPFLLPHMDRAVDRILQAVHSGETIAVYGDFDTDGVTATALLHGALTGLGGRVVTYIPHRIREGHGLNLEAIASLGAQGASLMITVDTGITGVQEVETASDVGMETIITDHHVPPEVAPRAYAIITPRTGEAQEYPNPHLTGAGLAFKLAQGVYQRLGRPPDDAMLELAALGTVADMAPLRGENRSLARAGLEALRRTESPGLRALLKRAKVGPGDLDHETIPFVLAPRLNAAGRIDGADPSFKLLTCTDPVLADELAESLEQRNDQRRSLTETMLASAMEEAQQQVESESLLFLASEEFAPGINGLVASRLAETFYRPTVVAALDGDVARASARSIPEFHLAGAFDQCSDLFLRHGGHPAAAGFVAMTRDLPALQRRLQGLAREALGTTDLTPRLGIDAEVSVPQLLGDTFDFLRSLAPFGQGNPPPIFVTRGMRVVSVRAVGGAGQHLTLTVKHEGAVWDAIAFNQVWPGGPLPRRAALSGSDETYLDLVYTLGVDNVRGRGRMQLRVLDFRVSGA